MSQLLSKILLVQTKIASNLPALNQTNNFIKVAKSFLNSSSSQQNQQNQQTENVQNYSNDLNEKISFLNSKLIDYNQGWKNLNVSSLCNSESNQIFINSNTGFLIQQFCFNF